MPYKRPETVWGTDVGEAVLLTVTSYGYYLVIVEVLFRTLIPIRDFGSLHWLLLWCSVSALVGTFAGMFVRRSEWTISFVSVVFGLLTFMVGSSILPILASATVSICLAIGITKGAFLQATMNVEPENHLSVRRRAEFALVCVYSGEVVVLVVGLALCDRL